MRKFFAAILCLVFFVATVSCVAEPEKGDKEYLITFRQNGRADIIRKWNGREIIGGIPEIEEREGYDVGWSITDFSTVTDDTVVTVTVKPKTYVVTLDPVGGKFADGGTDNGTLSVVFNGEYVLPGVCKDGYNFVSWKTEENVGVTNSGKWSIARNVTLHADYAEIEREILTVTLVQSGYRDTVIKVRYGETLLDTPVPKPVKGHTVTWDNYEVLTMPITESVTVHAVATPNEYTVTLNEKGVLSDVKVTYGEKFTFPVIDGVLSWRLSGELADYSGEIIYEFDRNVEFIAKYKSLSVVINVPADKDVPSLSRYSFDVDYGSDIVGYLEYPSDKNTQYIIVGYYLVIDGEKTEITKETKGPVKIYQSVTLELKLLQQWSDNY